MLRFWTLPFLALFLATPALSTDGTTPLWQPTTITESGKYRLTRDITSATGLAIGILADDVEIDLNGFTVRGGISASDSSATILGPSFRIENGTVIGSVQITPSVPGTAVVRNLVIKNGGIVVTDNTFRAVVENNVIHDASYGIMIEAVAGIIRNNIIDRPTQAGIHIEECLACDIVGNVVTSSQGVGIYAINGASRVSQNTVTRCAGNGIEVGTLSQIEGNVAVQNQGFGIQLLPNSSQAVYRGNTARGNGGSGCPNPTGANFCDAGTGNTSHGDNYMPGQM